MAREVAHGTGEFEHQRRRGRSVLPARERGERLVAFYTDPALQPSDIWERLCQGELPRLWIPKREDIHFVEAIPTLGTGKTDLRGVKALAASYARTAVV